MMLVLILTVPGCTTGIGGLGPRDSQALEVPAWEVGDWWLYTFETPEFGEDSARLVVTEEVDAEGHWMLGISSEREAQRHAVINHNPFLGRVTYDGLSVYENGMPQPVFSFPWTRGDTWSFTLFGMIWQAETVAVQGHEARMVANSGPDLLEITFDGDRGFIQELTWSTGPEVNLRMTLTQSGAATQGMSGSSAPRTSRTSVGRDSMARHRTPSSIPAIHVAKHSISLCGTSTWMWMIRVKQD